jgi:hypothetical protein
VAAASFQATARDSYVVAASWLFKGRGRSAHSPGGRGGKKLMPSVPGRRGKSKFAFSAAKKAPASDNSSIFEFDM